MRKTIGLTALAAYALTVVAANWAINKWGFVPIGFGLTAPAGVYFAGLAFTFRDVAQEAFGRGTAIAARLILTAIAVGAALSYVVAQFWSDPSPVVTPGRLALASAVAFGLSELADFGVFSKMRERGWLRAVTVSNGVGLVADSLIFLLIAFGSAKYIVGQMVGKGLMTGAALILLVLVGSQRRAVEA